jgi:hypothetical protein
VLAIGNRNGERPDRKLGVKTPYRREVAAFPGNMEAGRVSFGSGWINRHPQNNTEQGWGLWPLTPNVA